MTTVSSRVFSANPIRYLNLAGKEQISIKRGKRGFLLALRENDSDLALYDQAKANDCGAKIIIILLKPLVN